MGKSAVVFAAYMPKIRRSLKYIDTLKAKFSDCDIYVGINDSPIGFEQLLHNEGLTNTIRVNPEIEVDSDASAFQAALSLMKCQNKVYDTIYFTHTKGASYESDKDWITSCDSYFTDFCYKRAEFDALLAPIGVGGVGYVGRKEPMNGSGYSTDIAKYYEPRFTDIKDVMSLITMYVIKGTIVKNFLDTVKDDFFTSKLDRYFFETSFPLIIDQYGLERAHHVMW